MSDDVLRIEELRTAVGLALDQFVAEFGAEVPIRRSLYWHLDVEESFDMSREPSGFTVGSAIDDIAEVGQLVAERRLFPSRHTLMHVIGLLRMLENAARP